MRDPRLQNFTWETPQERCRQHGRRAGLALQEQQQALETQNWVVAVDRTRDLLQAVSDLNRLSPPGADGFWKECSEAVGQLTAALYPLLNLQSDRRLPQPECSELSWQLTTLLDQALTTPTALPDWVGVMHTQLLLHGAIDWRDRLGEAEAQGQIPDGDARQRAARMFGRAAHRLDPLPDWVLQACRDLGVRPIADPEPELSLHQPDAGGSAEAQVADAVTPLESTAAPEPLPPVRTATAAAATGQSRLWPPSELAQDLEQWLVDAGPRRRIRIGLASIPGAAMLCREGSSVDLNLAALLQDPSGVVADPWFEALRDPLQRALAAGWLQQVDLCEPFSSLYNSLAHHWLLGGVLPLSQLRRIPALLDAWSRVLGPAQLQAQRLSSSLIRTGSGTSDVASNLQVWLDPLELAALAACADGAAGDVAHDEDDESPAQGALAELRRRHLDSRFWQAESTAVTAPVEALRLLQRDAGFYASSADPMGCFASWRDGTMACLEKAWLWGAERGQDVVGLLSLGQQITQHSGRLPSLRSRLPLQSLLERFGGREVLYVGWFAEAVLDQHRSGRAFRLFCDQSIVPYGLRAVPMPDSRHPRRPHGGFRDSLDHLIAAVEAEHQARPVDLLVVDVGAYRLPLIAEIDRRHGTACVAPGPELLQLFGLDQSGSPRWSEAGRDPAMWRDLG